MTFSTTKYTHMLYQKDNVYVKYVSLVGHKRGDLSLAIWLSSRSCVCVETHGLTEIKVKKKVWNFLGFWYPA